MSELQEMSENTFGFVDQQIVGLAERLIAICEEELEWIQKEGGDRARLAELLATARETELLVSEYGRIPDAPAGLIGRASRLVSRIVASIDGGCPR